jgi:hypothetical protein
MNSTTIVSIKELLERKKIDDTTFQKMCFIFNALDEGWTVKKKKSLYVFSKKNEQQKKIIEDNYLMDFIKSNMDLNKILN